MTTIYFIAIAILIGVGVLCAMAFIVMVIEAISEWRDERREKQQIIASISA